jgi:hypothetical protein
MYRNNSQGWVLEYIYLTHTHPVNLFLERSDIFISINYDLLDLFSLHFFEFYPIQSTKNWDSHQFKAARKTKRAWKYQEAQKSAIRPFV